MVESRNRNLATAWRFHNATKYVRVSDGSDDVLMGEAPNLGPAIGEQDPAIEPLPYKIYRDLAPIPLPREFPGLESPRP